MTPAFAYLMIQLTFYPFGIGGPPEQHTYYIPKASFETCEADRHNMARAGVDRAYADGQKTGLFMDCTPSNPFQDEASSPGTGSVLRLSPKYSSRWHRTPIRTPLAASLDNGRP